MRRIEALIDEDLAGWAGLRLPLAAALAVPFDILDEALADVRYLAWARADRDYRRTFVPHVVWRTTHAVPRPIVVAAMIGAARWLIHPLHSRQPLRFRTEAMVNCPEGVPCYGRVTGFFINYTPDAAVEFDRGGVPQAQWRQAVKPGRALVRLPPLE